MFPVVEQNRGDRTFKVFREVEAVVMRWVITQDTDVIQQGIEQLVL
jgi:hypothetical protein